jgi:hypothetical protein
MASYENCSSDTELVSVATLGSIFEMEQVVVMLDENKIPWQVVEHDDIIMKNFSGNIGHSTLLVESGKEKESLELLRIHRRKQIEGHECSGCGLWLGPTVESCPACGHGEPKTSVEV